MVVLEQAAESLAADEFAVRFSHGIVRVDDAVVESLMVPLRVVTGDVLAHGVAEHGRAEEDQAVQALILDRADEAFGIGIEIGAAG